MLLCKGYDTERSRSYVKINGIIRFLDLTNVNLDTKIVILSVLVQTLLSKTDVYKMVDQRKIIPHISRPNCSRYFSSYFKTFTQATLC